MLGRRLVFRSICAVLSLAGFPARASEALKLGAFIDSYYAYDFDHPPSLDRILLYPSGNAYATQPVRNNEFNVNLAFVEAKLQSEKIRGRLALQAGNSVQVNYAADSAADQARYGGAGGISRYFQEAYVGYQAAPRLWVTGGIFFSHLGFESWISRDDWCYTRALVSDNSPYYQTGVKVDYRFSDLFSAQVDLLNGWQNINENNPQKSVGTQIVYTPNGSFTYTYNTFFGREPDGTGTQGSRIYQELIAKWSASDRLQLAAELDLGLQKPGGSDSTNPWYAATLFAQYQTSPVASVALRVEKFIDLHEAVIGALPTGFDAAGVSVGINLALQPTLLWRNEVRGFFAAEDLFPTKSGASNMDGFVVSSLALTL